MICRVTSGTKKERTICSALAPANRMAERCEEIMKLKEIIE
ncbi:hypothetical protein AWRI1631_130110 [Saccharomyces cerevisiae AWRI1631]|uniref:Uncharacterized protein n=1 Tax=Saccharomyces cerevisiae (strain AWRI1631) TaxID=545124 RepID=B5VP07_YEAS6|nr:hypothetical protein AWRI1631_130110 [Saccharomyces cerevisiae AWRI1631]